jgi:hypothetical protein
MSNVIQVEFGKKNIKELQGVHENPSSLTAYPNSVNKIYADQDSCLFEYLDDLRKQGIDEDDILEVADAISSYDIYRASDEVVQQLADGWLQNIV